MTAVDVPDAVIRPRRARGWLWLIPLAAVVFSAWLAKAAWSQKGVHIELQFEEGHGLAPGDELRHRGIGIGIVDEVLLAKDRDGIVVNATLRPEAEDLARGGTRFWIVRPQLDFTGIGGLETVIGPRYVAVLPGSGGPQQTFIGLESTPVVERRSPGDLEVVVESPTRAGMSPGAPVLYRQVRVGSVLSVGLTSDGGSVESRLHIESSFVHLVRPETRFWNVGGIETQLSPLGGLSLRFDSLETLLAGGVALSTPPDSGEVVRNGHRFQLAAEAEDDWLNWEPMVSLGSDQLPPGAPMPRPLLAKLSWKQDRFIIMETDHSVSGWVLLTERGLLGPTGLLHPSGEFEPGSVALEISGEAFDLPENGLREHGELALVDLEIPGVRPWPQRRSRVANEPEECLAIGDPGAEPLPLAAARLSADGERRWSVDSALTVDPSLHGAVVLARADGHLVGVLLVDEDSGAAVALLSDEG